jgi:pyridoxamine 5'-phosphate oxidase
VPHPPRDGGERRVVGQGRTVGHHLAVGADAQRPAAAGWLPEVFGVGEPVEALAGAFEDGVRQHHKVVRTVHHPDDRCRGESGGDEVAWSVRTRFTRSVDLVALRLGYEQRGIDLSDLDPDPLTQLRRWFDQAVADGVHQSEALALASVDEHGAPSVRLVLMRHLDARGLVFFTNYDSRKGLELAADPRAAVVFPWHQVSRQVRLEGRVEPVSVAESDAYFAARPRPSQLGAQASPQSAVVADRAALDAAYHREEQQWQGRPVPRPENWGGLRLVPHELEFWQGRANRLHDRLRYRLGDGPSGWIIDRLGP